MIKLFLTKRKVCLKKNIVISQNKAKLFSSVIITGLVTIILLSLTAICIKKSFIQTNELYNENCNNIVDSYAHILNTRIDNYLNILNSFYLEDQYKDKSIEEIHETVIGLKAYKIKTAPEFQTVFYITKEGMAYSQEGDIIDISNRGYYRKIFSKKMDGFVSDPVESRINGTPCIILLKQIYDDDGAIIAALGGAIELKQLTDIFTNIKIADTNIIVLDSIGRFIVNDDPEWLFKTFDPAIYGDKGISSTEMSKLQEGSISTIDTNGNPVRICYKSIDKSSWTLGLVVPAEKELAITNELKSNTIKLIIITLSILFLLLIGEYLIFEDFQKRKLVSSIYDPLTNLWTRQYFEKEAAKMIKRYSKNKFMLIECDIRAFKFINQNYGEESANKTLILYAETLQKLSDQYHGLIGRGFADRFYVFLKIRSVHHAMNIFKEQLEIFNKRIKSSDIPFFPKFGISFLIPKDTQSATSIQELIGQASFAKSTIKDNMMIQYSIYNSRLNRKITQEQYIESHMQQALENGEFFVMYQPKISLEDEKLVGAEALVRWRSPKFGLLAPDNFIPLFEKNGFITTLDFYVYEQVFKYIQTMIENNIPIVPISVNMSRNHSKPEKFMHQFIELFKKYEIPPKLVQIEILERSFMDSETLREITDALHKEGFSVAMDDFGSGESSLNMLTKIPVDVLKFDRDFLRSSTNEKGEIDDKSAGFIQILIELSKQLNKETVFEGVETRQQMEFLKKIQCDQAQGYYYSRPLTSEDFLQFIKLH